MNSRHSEPVRGLSSTKTPPFAGRFGRLFPSLPAAHFGTTDPENQANLGILAEKMTADFDPPKDGKDDEESGIPALYTYFGQFLDHDITFDPNSSLQKQNDPDALIDFRTPALDLDSVYGRGPNDQPYLYDLRKGEYKIFLLGDRIHGGAPGARDLPRNNAKPRRALIGDPRNDENSIVSQLQGLILRFHNRLVQQKPRSSFEEIQQLVRFHYQYVVLNDFLPQIVHSDVLRQLKTGQSYDRHKLEFFQWDHQPFMPVEFSVAAYRLGHSMIRPGYRLNDSRLLPILPMPTHGFPEGLAGFQAMKPNRGIDWGRFIDVDIRKYDGSKAENRKRLQFAYRIDTSIVNPLSHLVPAVVSAPPPSLAFRNLERGWRLGLPSGQTVAHAMRIDPLPDSKILIGKGVDQPGGPLPDILQATKASVFKENCPLWTYILAEAMHHREPVKIPVKGKITISTPRLGPVGGRIVAEVILGLLFGDSNSLLSLDPDWKPDSGRNYTLKDLVKQALRG